MIPIPLRKWVNLLVLSGTVLVIGIVGGSLFLAGMGTGMIIFPIAALVNYWFAVRRLKEL